MQISIMVLVFGDGNLDRKSEKSHQIVSIYKILRAIVLTMVLIRERWSDQTNKTRVCRR